MPAYELLPSTYDGVSINDATYSSWFERADNPLAFLAREPVEVELAGEQAFPVSPRSQPSSVILPLRIELKTLTQTALNAFQTLFDPLKGDVLLKITDGDSVSRRLTVRLIDTPGMGDSPNLFVARLYVARPIWESDTENNALTTASAS